MVVDQGKICEWFDIKTGVKQECNMSGFLFLIIMRWVMRRTVGIDGNGIRWKDVDVTLQRKLARKT